MVAPRTSLALLGVAVAFGCGGSVDTPAGDGLPGSFADAGHPDARVSCSFDPHCGQPCAADEDCGTDLYCGPDDRCTADCTPAGEGCQSGRECAEHGRCVDDCPSVTVALTPEVPIVALLIDQSGSMTTQFNGMTRWAALKQALVDPTDGVLYALQANVLFGATLYTSNGGSAGGTCPMLEADEPALDNASDIASLLAANLPSGDTPTGESISALTASLQGLQPDPTIPVGPKLILLATDGEPDTCAVPNPQTGQAPAIAAAQAAAAAGIDLIILSVGSGFGSDHLQEMANAGAGLPVDGSGGNAPYYVANDPQALADHFRSIIWGVRTCTFTLDGEVDLARASEGQVLLDGRGLAYGTEWQLADGSTLELLGDACTEFQQNPDVILAATFPCGTVIN